MTLMLNLKIFEDVLSHLHGTKKVLTGGTLHRSECNSTKYEFGVLQCHK